VAALLQSYHYTVKSSRHQFLFQWQTRL